jgi:uncharacterized membrane protein YtjA (UPF0391 family)
MLKTSIVFLVLGAGSVLFGFFDPPGLGASLPQLLALVSLTLFLIFLILGLPFTRNLIR